MNLDFFFRPIVQATTQTWYVLSALPGVKDCRRLYVYVLVCASLQNPGVQPPPGGFAGPGQWTGPPPAAVSVVVHFAALRHASRCTFHKPFSLWTPAGLQPSLSSHQPGLPPNWSCSGSSSSASTVEWSASWPVPTGT